MMSLTAEGTNLTVNEDGSHLKQSEFVMEESQRTHLSRHLVFYGSQVYFRRKLLGANNNGKHDKLCVQVESEKCRSDAFKSEPQNPLRLLFLFLCDAGFNLCRFFVPELPYYWSQSTFWLRLQSDTLAQSAKKAFKIIKLKIPSVKLQRSPIRSWTWWLRPNQYDAWSTRSNEQPAEQQQQQQLSFVTFRTTGHMTSKFRVQVTCV